MIGIPSTPYSGHRTEYFVTGKIKNISQKRHWRFLWKKVSVYQIEFSSENIHESFSDAFGNKINFPSSIKLLNGQKILGEKEIGDTMTFTICYADSNKQFYQRVLPFTFFYIRRNANY